jgi:hypothetical protein
MFDLGVEAETEEAMNRGTDAAMKEKTAKHLEERIDTGMDQAKNAEIEAGMDEEAEERRTEMKEG